MDVKFWLDAEGDTAFLVLGEFIDVRESEFLADGEAKVDREGGQGVSNSGLVSIRFCLLLSSTLYTLSPTLMFITELSMKLKVVVGDLGILGLSRGLFDSF